MRTRWVVLAVLLVLAPAARGSDWPQFMGPNRNGTAPGERLVRSWPKDGPKELWTVKLGPGFGGPAIRDGRVYVLDRQQNRENILRCFDLDTGEEKWRFAHPIRGKLSYNGSRSTPTVGEKYIYTIGPFGQMHCIDRATHKPAWTKHLLKDFDSRRHRWGVSQSPLLHKETVIIAPLSKTGPGVVALEKATGKVVWKSPGFGPMRYMSPQVRTIGGVEQILMASYTQTAGIEPGTGRVLWTYGKWRCSIPVPTPTLLPDDRIFISGGYGAGSVVIRVRKAGGAFQVEPQWRLKRLGSHIHMPLVHDGHIYAQFNTKRTHDGLACVTLDGKVKWQTDRDPNFDWGGMILADGLILAMDGRTGVLRLVEPDPGQYKELAASKVLGGRHIWAPMALADGRLVCRDQRQMKCLVVGPGE
ncbi:MAG: PQQ-binding-like beta-propeller repeat protein [Planctomycetota bacterium]